jgi:GDP-L-fucose synthase
MKKNSKILVTGSGGMVGSSLAENLSNLGYSNLILLKKNDLDLRNQLAVENFFKKQNPEYVFHLAAIVGGIHANNSYPAKFIYDNTQMHLNVIESSSKIGVKKLLFPGSACTYPRLASQPISEESFLSGLLEPTNLAYAVAKINGIVTAQSYSKQFGLNVVVPMPTNAYGVGDNFDIENSHVIPALIRRFYDAKLKNEKEILIWGSGNAMREFIYVDDLADGLIFLMLNYNDSKIINIGSMQEISIKDLAFKIAKIVNYEGQIKFDISKPDGMPRKCLNSSKIHELGWKAKVSIDEGLEKTFLYFLNNKKHD